MGLPSTHIRKSVLPGEEVAEYAKVDLQSEGKGGGHEKSSALTRGAVNDIAVRDRDLVSPPVVVSGAIIIGIIGREDGLEVSKVGLDAGAEFPIKSRSTRAARCRLGIVICGNRVVNLIIRLEVD